MAHPVTEWASVAGDKLIIARESGEVWIGSLNGVDEDVFPFAKPMTCAGALGSTVGLLDGAIGLGFEGKDSRRESATPTLTGYAYALVGAYHTSVNTPRNLLRAADRFRELGRIEVAEYLEKRAREETGHDRLALKDLDALGMPGERIVANLMPDDIEPLCARFDELCVQEYPIGCVGYSYCLERIAALKQKSDVDAVKVICPDGVDATRFLRSHSSLGSEATHVTDTIEFVASLPADDRIKVVQETYETALIMAEGYHRILHKSDSEMLEELEQAAGEALHIDFSGHSGPGVAELASQPH